ncbi:MULTISPECIES: phage portal protein [Fusobacterium]|jgi:HK97 family phage portal protein|uniref:phage portal protein n=1 Tax=Fusobacterium TaxID=848 RepID=UPI000E9FE99D|nr:MULTISPECIES: phage portal protein [Fusobacterium]DAE77831.1 MAG TPA: portal protein [Caudoviricetes sp.]HBJ79739.1 hypothetical protein [Fusobacterium sp.]
MNYSIYKEVKRINLIKKAASYIVKKIPLPWGYNRYSNYSVDYDNFIKGAYENPFIQAPFQEFITDLKTLQFGVYSKENGNYKESSSSSAKYVLNSLKRPNKELGFKQFIEAMATYIIFGGRCLLYKTKGVYSCDVYLYNPNTFETRRNESNLQIEYIMLGDTIVEGKELNYYHIVKSFDPHDTLAGYGDGYSKIKPLAMVGDMLNFLLKHNNSLLKNGGRITGILSFSSGMDKHNRQELVDKFKSDASGAREAGAVGVVIGEGMKYEPMGTNPKDLDWIEGMKELQKIICRVLGIPETLIISENSSYNNLEGFKKKVYEDTIIPFAEFLCEELTEFFRDDLEENEEIYFSTNKIRALQSNIADEIKKYADALQGKISQNDFIKFINDTFEMSIPLLPTDIGNKVLVATNMMFLDELGVTYEPPPNANTSK